MHRWTLRSVHRYVFALWPSGSAHWIFLIVLALSSVIAVFVYWGDPGEDFWRSDYVLTGLTVCVFMIRYGAHRAFHYHPATDRAYRGWLLQSPFDGSNDLPLGPAQLVGRDLVAVCFAAPFCIVNPWISIWLPAQLLLAAYLFVLARIFSLIHLLDGAWFIALGLALSVGTIRYPGLSLLLLVVTYLLILPVLRRSVKHEVLSAVQRLADIAFQVSRSALSGSTAQQREGHRQLRKEQGRSIDPHARRLEENLNLYSEQVGWPLASLGPGDIEETSQTPRSGVATGLLLSAWVAAALHLLPESFVASYGLTSPKAFLGYAVCAAAFARLVAYAGFMRSPISLAGRVRTGRLIIWSYDRIFVVPCISIIASLTMPRLLESAGISLPWAISITVFSCVAVLISAPPTLRSWILTGHYRLTGVRQGASVLKRV